MKKYVALIIVILLCLSGCFSKKDRLTKLLYNGISVIPTTSSDYSYAANDPQGNTVFYDYQDNRVNRSLSRDRDGNWLGVDFNSESLPNKVYTEDHTVVIDNVEDNQADLVVIDNQDESTEPVIYREVDFDLEQPDDNNFETYADALRYIALFYLAWAEVLDDIGVEQSPAHQALEGTNTINRALAEYSPEDFELVEASCEAFVLGTTALDYAEEDAAECLDLAVQLQQKIDEYEEARLEYIQLAEGILSTGYGDIQITLTWDTVGDVDLHVIDPFGEEIFYAHKRSSSGGWLDADNTQGYGPENVFWERGDAPPGEYQVDVEYYEGNRMANYQVSVIVGSSVKVYEGSLHPNERVNICRKRLGQNA